MAPRSKRSINSAIRGPLSALGRSNSRACRSRFCRTLSSPYSEKLWDMKPTRLRVARSLAFTGRPSRVALPSLAGIRPVSTFMVVVLPQPLEPRKPKISPRPMAKLTLFTAVKSPKRKVSSWASMAISALPVSRAGITNGCWLCWLSPWKWVKASSSLWLAVAAASSSLKPAAISRPRSSIRQCSNCSASSM
ncbi:hypothetical protein D3C79_791050 [compost metagenome]